MIPVSGEGPHSWIRPYGPAAVAELRTFAEVAGWDVHILDPDHPDGTCAGAKVIEDHHQLVVDAIRRAVQLGRPVDRLERPVVLIVGALPRGGQTVHQLSVLACHGPVVGVRLALADHLAAQLPRVFADGGYITGRFDLAVA
ncbi:hypothetical protein ACWDSJ_01050 [Nocardia sp. NPDC003482]|uniref:hypothetical protein n=1 Tax=Nocardia sp. NPDC004068 TaxID=3364303 RepID=UPI00368D764E